MSSSSAVLLWSAAALAAVACWAVSAWVLWASARGGKPATGALWKLLAAAGSLMLGAAARTVHDGLKGGAGADWRSDGLVYLVSLLLVLAVPLAVAAASPRERD